MNEEKQTKTSRPKPPIGSSIPQQYKSFGSSNGGDTENDNDVKHPAVQTSKSPAVQTAEHLEFETFSSSTTQQSNIPAVQASSNSNVKKSKHPDWKQQTVYLPPSVIKWLRVHAAEAEIEISEIVALAIQEYRERYKP